MPPTTDSSESKLRDRAYGYICQQFIDGSLRAGSRLSVGALAREMGISRTPVAEALLRLQMEDVVEQVPRVGTIVRKPSVKEIAELYELRELLEGHAAAKAAERFAPADLELLDRLLGEMREVCVELRESGRPTLARDAVRRYLAVDLAFHMIIVRGVGNRRIRKVLEHTRAFLLIFSSSRHEEHTLKTVSDIYLWHARIRNAIRRGDPDAARAAMVQHIWISREGALDYLSRHEPAATDVGLDLSTLIPKGFDSLGQEASRGSRRPPTKTRAGRAPRHP